MCVLFKDDIIITNILLCMHVADADFVIVVAVVVIDVLFKA